MRRHELRDPLRRSGPHLQRLGEPGSGVSRRISSRIAGRASQAPSPRRSSGAYHLYLLETEAPIARLMPTRNGDEVQLGYWSHRRRWEDIDDFGGRVMSLDNALALIANESIFWIWTC